MSVLIGHASIDENGKAHGGAAGDQTGKEVCIRNWYNNGWSVLLRPKTAAMAEKMASACEILCKSNLVGYDQWQRNTLWDRLEEVGWDASKMKTKCETDCSAYMTAIARIGGANVPRVSLGNGQYNAPVTSTMRKTFSSTGMFEVLTDSKYLTSDKYLKRGDILVKETAHTVMVLSNGELAGGTTNQPNTAVPNINTQTNQATGEVKATAAARAIDSAIAGVYYVTANSGLNMRHGPSTKYPIMVTMPKGTKVRNYGYFTLTDGVKWLYVQVTYNGVKYTGFCSGQYLEK